MAKTALLHIGTPKTGTTSIQECLAEAQVSGRLSPVCYPLIDGERNHHRLMPLYFPHNEISLHWRRNYPVDDRRFRKMRQHYRQLLFAELNSAQSAIMSSEELSLRFTPRAVTQLRRDLESVGFEEFHIVLYVRDPADYYLSSTQQALKSSADNPQKIRDPASFKYRFLQAAEIWEEIFPGCLIVRGFPKGSELDVLDDFAALVNRLMGVELPHIPVRMNTTLSAEGMQILLDYRQKFGAGPDGFIAPICPPDARRISLFLERSTADIRQTKPVLKNEVASRIRANHRADAELILSRYGVDLGLGGIRDDTTRVIHPLRVIEDILAALVTL